MSTRMLPPLFYTAKKGNTILVVSPLGERLWECVNTKPLKKKKETLVEFKYYDEWEKKNDR